MTSLPKSAYFRLSEAHSREPARYGPDYPLVLFVLFSRWSLGIAIVSGFFQVMHLYPDLVKVNMDLALALIVAATLISIFHLSDRIRFMAMVKNPQSRISQEVFLTGTFMVTVALNSFLLHVLNPADFIRIVFACAVIGLGIITLGATGWAYKFYSHPLWNTNILSIYYISFGLLLGQLTMYWTGLLFDSVSVVGVFKATPAILAGLLLMQFLSGSAYLRYVYRGSNEIRSLSIRTKQGRMLLLYGLTGLVLPTVFLVISAIIKGFLILFTTCMLVSLLSAVFIERAWFFTIENPNYLFRVLSEKKI